MKQGIVEVPLTGDLADFDDAILIKRINVESINKIIQQAGKRKLRVMNEAAKFRRNIICMEWEHNTMIMEIEDLRAELKAIQKSKLTKEMQDYLRRRYRGLPDDSADIGVLEKELHIVREYYDKAYNKKWKQLKEIEEKLANVVQQNENIDHKIENLNVSVNDQQLKRDMEFEGVAAGIIEARISAVMRRSRLCSKIQDQHGEILVLQTELELLRLKTYPTLKYNTLA